MRKRRLVVEPLEDRVNPAPVLYANDAAGALYTIDAATGATTLVGNTGVVMTDIAFGTDGKLFGVDAVSNFYRVDPDTAAITLLSPFGFPVTGLGFNSGNGLYAAGTGFYYKFFHETSYGSHLIGEFPAGTVAGDVAFDANNNAYITTQNDELARVSYSDGSLTIIGALGFDDVQGLAFANGVMYGVSRTTSQVITINLTTGAGTAVSTHAGPATTGLTFFGEHVTFDAEPNDAPAQSQTLATPVDILRGRIANVLDVDRFQVTLQQGDTWKVGIDLAPENGWPDMGPAFEIADAIGTVIGSATDGHTLVFTAPRNGTYRLTLTSGSDFIAFSGEYALRTSVESFSGTTETEPNDALANAAALTPQATFRGALASASDVDSYTMNAYVGQALVVNYGNAVAGNPATRIYAPDGTLIASDRSGAGLHLVLSQSGVHRIAVGTDNLAGIVTGQYVGQVIVADRPLAEAEAEDGFENAPVVDFGPSVISANYLSPTASFAQQGLTGSYVNASLRSYATQDDWRTSQVIAGTRIDPTIHFPRNGWGFRDPLGITGGTDNDWENYSVQWDGFIMVVTDGMILSLASDDGSRMWIDLNNDGVFDSSGPEFLDNYWGYEHGTNLLSTGPVPAGTHRIRIQYEEVFGGNNAFLLWDDRAHSTQVGALYQFRTQVGTLSSLDDVDVFAVDLAATAIYDFRLQASAGRLSSQGRELTLSDEFGHMLRYSTVGGINTSESFNYIPLQTGRYYLSIRATTEAGLGTYSIGSYPYAEFPGYRDVPLFYQDHSEYDFTEQVPGLLAFFESRFDIYQVDITETNPGPGSEHVDWRLAYEPTASGGGFEGGSYGERRPSGGGLGQVTYEPTRFSDAVQGLAYHENGHGIGIYHNRHPLAVMGYGSQYDLFPIGTMTEGENLVPTPRIQNERNYMDWVLEAGRIVLEGEGNDTRASAQQLAPYIAEMGQDADPRNDQAVVAGALSRADDADWYSFFAAAGETFAIDIDSAEFQTPLDARLDLFDSVGNLLASNLQALDRDSGIASVDPYLVHTFVAAGTYFIRVSGEHGTSGNYRLKVSPERTFDRDGPRITAAFPDGGAVIDSTRVLTFWTNDQLDPATLTNANIIVSGQTTGVHAGTAIFNHLDSVLMWTADAPLPPDTYTITITTGVTDLRGNPIDGETDGMLDWPEISGNGIAGGNFVLPFTVNAPDTDPAFVYYSQFYRQDHNRGLIDLWFTDAVDSSNLTATPLTLHGSGNDHVFGTTDDTLAPLDLYYGRIFGTAYPQTLLRAYTRGLPDPGTYRVEGTVFDTAGFSVTVSRDISIGNDVPAGALFTTASLSTPGLVGSYIDDSLRTYAPQDDWRVTQSVAGTRIDPVIAFSSESFGLRSEVNLTKGTDLNWEDFSVQWDGFITIPANGVRLFTRSDDGSRLWIDLNNDGAFNSSGDEFVNNNWGFGQGVFTGPASIPLNAGTYRIRMQYEEEVGGNRASLLWDYSGGEPRYDNARHGVSVIDVNVQPNTAITTAPTALVVTFNQDVDPVSLNPATVTLLYSPDEHFFDGNDIEIADADGVIVYDAVRHEATFTPAVWPAGYYLLQLSDAIASPDGRGLDGEYLDGNIAGYAALDGWQDTPSGDTRPGGDYRAYFRVDAPLAATVDMDAAAITYGEDGTVTVTVSAGFGTPGGTVELSVDGGSPLSATLAGGSATFTLDALPAGSHTLVATYLGSTNYLSDSASDSISVLPAVLTVTAANKSKVYGASLPSLTYGVSGLVNGDAAMSVLGGQLATTATSASPVANYAIAQGTLALTSGNYTLSFVPGALTITPATLTVTAGNRTKVYGESLPTLTFSVSGLTNGDAQAAVLNGSPATTATTASPVGNYPISRGSLALTSGNYTLAFTGANLSVTPALLSVAAANMSRLYGAANPAFTYAATGFVNGDAPSVLTGSLSAPVNALSPVGNYPIGPGSLAALNYTIAYASGTLTITKAPLTITADDKSRPANRTNPPLTAQYAGFVNGDNSSVVSNLNLTTTAASNSPEGGYPITSSTTPTAVNYAITFVPGTLTVTAVIGPRLPSETAVGSGGGRAARVNAYDRDGDLITSFAPFGLFFSGGVRTATADFDGDGRTDVAVGTGPGTATSVRVYSGRNGDELFRVAPFESSFRGGVYLAAGDLTGDGVPELVITPDEGGGPRVQVYEGSDFTKIADFFGIDDSNFRGGARTAIGDFNGDGTGDLVVAAGFGGGPRIAVYDGDALTSTRAKLFNDLFLFEQTLRNGVFVAAADVDGDGLADLIGGGGPGGGPRVLVLDGSDLLAGRADRSHSIANFFAGNAAGRGGIRVAVKDLDGDEKADLVVGDGDGAGSRVTAYLGSTLAAGGTAEEFRLDAFSGFTGGVFVG